MKRIVNLVCILATISFSARSFGSENRFSDEEFSPKFFIQLFDKIIEKKSAILFDDIVNLLAFMQDDRFDETEEDFSTLWESLARSKNPGSTDLEIFRWVKLKKQEVLKTIENWKPFLDLEELDLDSLSVKLKSPPAILSPTQKQSLRKKLSKDGTIAPPNTPCSKVFNLGCTIDFPQLTRQTSKNDQ